MSVENNELIFPCKKYAIFEQNEQGVIKIFPKFQVLWKSFYPHRPRWNAEPSGVTLPSKNNIQLKGVLDPFSGFVNFRSLSGILDQNSAVKEQGVALPFFSSPSGTCDFKIFWRSTGPVRYVNFYFWNASYDKIRLSLDKWGNLSSYGKEGEASFFNPRGFFYVQVIADSNEYTISLQVTATPPEVNPFPLGKQCLFINNNEVPLYYTEATVAGYLNIPFPQWTFIASKIVETINELTAKNIPTSPLLFKQVAQSVYTENFLPFVAPYADAGPPAPLAGTKSTFYLTPDTTEIIYQADGNIFRSQLPIQDNGGALQAVQFVETNLQIIDTLPGKARVTLQIDGLSDTPGFEVQITAHQRDSGRWNAYPLLEDGEEVFFISKPITSIFTISFRVNKPNEICVQAHFPFQIENLTFSFRIDY